MSYETWANIIIPDWLTEINALVVAAGGESGSGLVSGKVLYVSGITQDALDAALLAFDNAAAAAAASREAGRYISSTDFHDRFSGGELAAIVSSADVGVKLLLLRLQTWSSQVDLESPEIVNGLAYLVSQGILTSDRADAIKAH